MPPWPCAPADIRPGKWHLDSLRPGSIGAAEIVAELREGWRREGWKQKADATDKEDTLG